MLLSVGINHNFADEIILRSGGNTVAQGLAGLTLQCGCEVSVAFVGNNGQLVHLVNIFAEKFLILANTVAVNADTQATAYLLTLGSGGIAVAKRTDLEHIRIIPALAERGMREDETCRFLETQQTFFIL